MNNYSIFLCILEITIIYYDFSFNSLFSGVSVAYAIL